jgi:hypothetical protein
VQVQGEDSEAALVTFENDEGVSTALLLSNSLLDDRVRLLGFRVFKFRV